MLSEKRVKTCCSHYPFPPYTHFNTDDKSSGKTLWKKSEIAQNDQFYLLHNVSLQSVLSLNSHISVVVCS